MEVRIESKSGLDGGLNRIRDWMEVKIEWKSGLDRG